MSQLPPKPLAEDVMSFLEHIETSFQEAETFLQGLNQKGYGQDLAETIQHVQMAKNYVSNLRQKLPDQLDAREDEIMEALRQARAKREPS